MTPHEQKLWQVFRETGSTEARNALVVRYMPLATRIGQRMSFQLCGRVSEDELIADAYSGLVRAIEQYRIDRGISFSTYAYSKVKYYLLDELRRTDSISRTHRRRNTSILAAEDRLRQRLGRPGADDEVRAELGLNDRAWAHWRPSRNMHIHLFSEFERTSFEYEPVDLSANPQHDVAVHLDLGYLLGDCNPRERALLLLNACLGWSTEECGRRFRISGFLARKHIRNAMAKARLRAESESHP